MATEGGDHQSLQSQVFHAVDRFDAAWQSVAQGAAPPRLEEVLNTLPASDQAAFLRDLLAVELECRLQLGAKPTADEYRARFPKHAELIEAVMREASQRKRSSFTARLNCPHCHNPIALVIESAEADVLCPSCGSTVHLDTGRSLTWDKQRLPKIAQFELLEAVGRGAFGTVYKARDEQLQRVVAIKIPRCGVLETDEDEDRFVREARNVAQLQHPGIVTIYSVGRTETFPYLVSEFVEGVTLSQYLTAKRFSVRDGAKLIRDVALALQHAHEQGVIHRDLKPSNIMLTPDGMPRIMDFGLAKRDTGEITMTLDGQILGTPAYMSPEQASGLAHQADARSDIYSVGAILFQLLTGDLPFRGDKRMLLYQVVHDEPPSPRKLNSQTPRDLDTICLKCLAKEPKRRYATAHELADDLQRHLDGHPILARPVTPLERAWRWCRRNPVIASLSATAVLLLALTAVVSTVAYRRESRFVQEVSRTNAALETANTEIRRQSTRITEQSEKVRETNAHLMVAKTDAETKRGEAEASAKVAREQSQLALGTLNSVIFDLQREFKNIPGGAAVRQRLLATALEKLEKVSTEFAAKSAVDRNTMAALNDMADAILQLGQSSAVAPRQEGRTSDDNNSAYDDPATKSASLTAERLYRRAFDIAKQLAAANPNDPQAQRDLSISFMNLGDVFLKLGRAGDALTQFQDKLKIDRALVEADPKHTENQRNLSISFDRLGNVFLKLGRTDDALTQFQEFVIRTRAAAEADPNDSEKQRDLSSSFDKLGDVFLKLGRTEDALTQFQAKLKTDRVLVEADPKHTANQRNLSISFERLGDVFLKLGRTDDALTQFQASSDAFRVLAEADPNDSQKQRNLSNSSDRLGDVFLKLGRTDDALTQFQDGLKIRRVLAEADPNDAQKQRSLSVSFMNLGDVFLKLDRTDDALTQFQASSAVFRVLAAADPNDAQRQRDLSISFERLGYVYLTLGRTDDALTQFQAKLKIDRVLVEADPKHTGNQRNLSISFIKLGDVFLKLGRTDNALTQFQASSDAFRVLAEADPNDAQNQRDLSVSFDRLGDVFLQLGRTDDALTQFEDGLKIRRVLAEADPKSAETQRALMISHYKLGEVQVQAGQFDAAQERFAQGIAVLVGMIAKGQSVKSSQQEKALLEQRRQFCTVAKLATGDWDTLLKADAKVLPELLLLRATEMLKRGEVARAVTAAERLRELTPKDKNNLYNAACLYARCAEFVTKDKPAPTDAEQAERQKFLKLALDCLKESLAAGWDDFAHIRKDDDLKTLQGLPEFDALFPK